MKAWLPVAYGAALVVPWATLSRCPQMGKCGPRRAYLSAVLLWLAVAIPSMLQMVWPALLDWGQRDTALVRGGEWWRLVTSAFLQDGGWLGTVFNLVTLAVTLVLAGRVLTTRTMVLGFLGGAILANLLTVLTFGQSGAGNSMATMIVAVLALWAARAHVPKDPWQTALGGIGALTLLLLSQRDQHGLALAVGLVGGAVLSRQRPSASTPRADGGRMAAMEGRPDERIITAERIVHAPAAEIFELIADPARQPSWDGNDNLDVATTSGRVRAVGDVFGMRTHKGKSKDNHVIAFEEGRVIAWRTADAGQEPPGHIWRWDLEAVDDATTRVTHTYDWTGVTDEARWPRHRQTTPAHLAASIDRLAALAESHG